MTLNVATLCWKLVMLLPFLYKVRPCDWRAQQFVILYRAKALGTVLVSSQNMRRVGANLKIPGCSIRSGGATQGHSPGLGWGAHFPLPQNLSEVVGVVPSWLRTLIWQEPAGCGPEEEVLFQWSPSIRNWKVNWGPGKGDSSWSLAGSAQSWSRHRILILVNHLRALRSVLNITEKQTEICVAKAASLNMHSSWGCLLCSLLVGQSPVSLIPICIIIHPASFGIASPEELVNTWARCQAPLA